MRDRFTLPLAPRNFNHFSAQPLFFSRSWFPRKHLQSLTSPYAADNQIAKKRAGLPALVLLGPPRLQKTHSVPPHVTADLLEYFRYQTPPIDRINQGVFYWAHGVPGGLCNPPLLLLRYVGASITLFHTTRV